MFLEVRIPKNLNVEKFKRVLKKITPGGLLRLSPGRMIDDIASEFKRDLERLGVNFTRNEWMLVKKALGVIARRHLSQVRKDKKNPYISHHIGAVQIIGWGRDQG